MKKAYIPKKIKKIDLALLLSGHARLVKAQKVKSNKFGPCFSCVIALLSIQKNEK